MSDKNTDWQPPNDNFNVREERAPWGRYFVYMLLLGAVAAGGIWLASQVVVTDKIPDQARIDLPAETPSEAPPMGADEAAWVQALEKDTLDGYREYLAEFPEGRFADKRRNKSTSMTTGRGPQLNSATRLRAMRITSLTGKTGFTLTRRANALPR